MTEKDYNPEQKQMKAMNRQKAANKAAAPAPKPVKKEEKSEGPEEKKNEKTEEVKPEEKKKLIERTKTKERPKKEEAVVRANDIPISTKHSAAICDFIRNKKLGTAIEELEEVLKFRKVIPMKGEIPHKHGKGIMAGRYPIKAAENFVKLLRSLASNALYNGIEEPVIVKAVANLGARPFGKFGAVRKKRTHIEIVVKEKVKKEKPSKKTKTKEENKAETKKDEIKPEERKTEIKEEQK